jgi:VWFA-related protein
MNKPRCVSLCLIISLPALACAQQASVSHGAASQSEAAPAAPAAGLTPISSASDGLIKLDVVVTDKAGRLVTGLESKDFALLDNGQPAKILSFQAFDGVSAKPDPPVEVILFIDTLDMPERLATHEREEVEKFLRQDGGHLAQPVSVFGLSDGGLWTLANPSGDGNALAAQIAHNTKTDLLRRVAGSARGPSAETVGTLRFAEPSGLSALKALGYVATAERRKPGRKLLLWVGSGWGQGSGRPFQSPWDRQHLFDAIYWFSTLLREARIALYSFSVGEIDSRADLYRSFLEGVKSTQQANIANLDRKVLAVESGGRVLGPTGNLPNLIPIQQSVPIDSATVEPASGGVPADLVTQIDRCVEEAGAFYTLSFNPAPADQPNEYRGLEVQVGKAGLTARTSTGYYDQPYYQDRPNVVARRVTVEQLEQLLGAVRGRSDGEAARQLSGLELTERLSGAKLSAWTASLHGEKARQALVTLVDASAFLDPPAAELPALAPPDRKARRRMLSLAIDYWNETMPKLPNFFATRTTVRFVETPQYDQGNTRIDYRPLHVADSARETVLYRNGREAVDAGETRPRKPKKEDPFLITYGTFGPLLNTVISDAIAASSGLTWSRWEQGAGGTLAVFRFHVPAEESHFEVMYCCLPDGDGTSRFKMLAGYRGEIAIDPASGAILRLTSEAELYPGLPISRSAIQVEYGPVEIGGKTYICPLRSVSLWRSRTVAFLAEWDESFRTYGPFATLLNDISYGDYHRFRAEARVLPEYDPAPEQK